MTCKDFKDMCNRNPLDCTAAERAAHYIHYETCKECNEFFSQFLHLLKGKVFTPDILRQVVDASLKDLTDPEIISSLKSIAK